MKKYLIIFTMAIISIIPILSVNAETFDTDCFEQAEFNLRDTIQEMFIEQCPEYNFDDFEYIVYYRDETIFDTSYDTRRFSVQLVPKILDIKFYRSGNNLGLYGDNRTGSKISSASFSITLDFARNTKIDLNKISSRKFFKTSIDLNNGQFYSFGTNSRSYLIVYNSTLPLYESRDSDVVIREPDVFGSKEYLSYNVYSISDNNTDLYNFMFYPINYNSSYKYMIKTSEDDNWVNISNLFTTTSDNDDLFYNYFVYYNTTIYIQVLDESNNILETKTYTIADLTDLDYINSFSSTSTDELYSVDFYLKDFNKLDVNIVSKLELQYGANDQDKNNRPIFNKYNLYALDEYNKVLDIDLSNYISFTYSLNKFYDDDYEEILKGYIHQIKPLPSSVKNIKIEFLFDNLKNYYIHTFDSYKNTDVDYTEYFLKDYVYYKFPTGYDLAIIRSKNFDNLNSSLISYTIRFSNSDYGLVIGDYDFINKYPLFPYLDYKNYVFNSDFLKIPLFIDEENNIFPILYKDVNKSNIDFYLYKDLFVVFLNSETLDYIVVNMDKEEYEKNNDLVIFGSIEKDVDDYFESESHNQSFFSKFKSSLNRFKDVILEIFSHGTYFFNNSNVILQDFFIVVFTLILFLFLIRFIL